MDIFTLILINQKLTNILAVYRVDEFDMKN